MVKQNESFLRENGIFYTPKELAKALISGGDLIPINKRIKIFDPAFGDGILLDTAAEHYRSRGYNVGKYGCDLNPNYSATKKNYTGKKLLECDFLEYYHQTTFDLIFMNPPYVRHSLIREESKMRISTSKYLSSFHSKSDFWVYFLIKSMQHLNYGGSIAAILPWSFLQADYAVKVRKVLYENFRQIKLIAFNQPFFQDASERVVFLYLSNFGNECKNIKIAYSNSHKEDYQFQFCKVNDWLRSKILFGSIQKDFKVIEQDLINIYNFKSLDELCKIKIGVVTGANKFFIKNLGEWDSIRINKKHLQPIITKSTELAVEKENDLKWILSLNESNERKHRDYLNTGITKKLHLRSHCKNRKPWYSINMGSLPDAFFPYRVKEYPYLAYNFLRCTSTNSVHRIYFKNQISLNQRYWLIICSLSIFSQLSFSVNCKTYGRALMKLEPGGLKNCILSPLPQKGIKKQYDSILKLILSNEKEKAVKLSTQIVAREFGIPAHRVADCYEVYQKIKTRSK